MGETETDERLASALLKLRRSLNGALLGLAAIEKATSLDEARALAHTARLEVRAILAEIARPATPPE